MMDLDEATDNHALSCYAFFVWQVLALASFDALLNISSGSLLISVDAALLCLHSYSP